MTKKLNSKQTATYPSLVGKSVLITGGASGIGADFVKGFVSQGAKVGFVDIDTDAASRLISVVFDEFGVQPWFRKTDMTIASEIEDAVEVAVDEMDGLHVLINNVGNDARHSIEDLHSKAWRACLAINLDSAYITSRAALGVMQTQKQGSIINLSSINALLGLTGMAGYVTAKAGLIGMTKALAREVGEYGVRVNSILPGWVETERQLGELLTRELWEEWRRLLALKEHLQVQDVTNLALFLAADESRMITGQSLIIDAGRT